MARIVRGLTLLVIVIVTVCFFGLVHGGLTAPTLPYSGTIPYTVGSITRAADAGSLQPRDNIITFNGHPFFTCIYFGRFTPIYDAPRNQEIPVTFWRPDPSDLRSGQTHSTSILLREPGFQELLGRGLGYLVGGVLLAVGVYYLVFRWPQLRLMLVTCLISSLLIASIPDAAQFRAPFGVAYWIGLPLWAICAAIALSEWPLNQLHRRIVQILIGVTTSLAVVSILTNALGWMGASCAVPSYGNLVLVPFGRDMFVPHGLLFNVRLVSSFAITLLPWFSLSYLLYSAYRLTSNRFVKTQIRTLAWVHGAVWFCHLVLSYIPILLGISVLSAAPYLLTAITLVLPITWAVVGFRSTIIGVEQFLNRTLFTLLLILSSVAIMFASFYALFSWIPNPDPILVTGIALIPIALFNLLLRRPFEKVVELALYGHYYNYEETSAALMQELTTPHGVQGIGRVLTHNIPPALLVESAAFWAKTTEGDLALIDVWNVADASVPTRLPEAELTDDSDVTVHAEPYRPAGSLHGWHVSVRLMNGKVLEGVLLLGPKLRSATYSEKDTRVLTTLANWIGGRLAGWRLAELEMKQEREQTLMLVEHEARIRGQVAEELHDRGITALSVVRLRAEQLLLGEEVRGALQRVIDDLRLLTSSHLKPSGLDYGLLSGLGVLVKDYEQIGATIALNCSIPATSPLWSSLSDTQNRELFYILQEAVTNSFKADKGASIVIHVADQEGSLRLSVQDTGPGFDTGPASANKVLHHGLSIMRARARNINANFNIESSIGVGTTVTVDVPLSPSKAL